MHSQIYCTALTRVLLAYVCTTCNEKRYTRASNLYRHMRVCQGPSANDNPEDGDSEDEDFDSPIDGGSGLSSSLQSEASIPSPIDRTRTFDGLEISLAEIDARRALFPSPKSARRHTLPSTSSAMVVAPTTSPKLVATSLPISERVYFYRPPASRQVSSTLPDGQTPAEWARSLVELAELARTAPIPRVVVANPLSKTLGHLAMSNPQSDVGALSDGSRDVSLYSQQQSWSKNYQLSPLMPSSEQCDLPQLSHTEGAAPASQEPVDAGEWTPVSYYLGPYFETSGPRLAGLSEHFPASSWTAQPISMFVKPFSLSMPWRNPTVPYANDHAVMPSNVKPIASYRTRRPSDPFPPLSAPKRSLTSSSLLAPLEVVPDPSLGISRRAGKAKPDYPAS
jgi:hypothetical protein